VKVQRVAISTKPDTWTVIGDDYLPVEPIQEFLSYLENIERSPNTIRSYAYNLKLYWEYLQTHGLDWTEVDVVKLAEFLACLYFYSYVFLPFGREVVRGSNLGIGPLGGLLSSLLLASSSLDFL